MVKQRWTGYAARRDHNRWTKRLSLNGKQGQERGGEDNLMHVAWWSDSISGQVTTLSRVGQKKVLHEDYTGDARNSYTILCNGAVSHGASTGGIRVFTDYTYRNKPNKIRLCGVAFHTYHHAQTAADAWNICTWRIMVILIRENLKAYSLMLNRGRSQNFQNLIFLYFFVALL